MEKKERKSLFTILKEQSKLFVRATAYSVHLLWRAGGIKIVFDILLSIILTLIPLLTTFVFKELLDYLTVGSILWQTVLALILFYFATIVLNHVVDSVKKLIHGSIYGKADNLYHCDVLRAISETPLASLDTRKNQDQLGEVRYAAYSAVNLTGAVVNAFTRIITFVVAFVTLLRCNALIAVLFVLITVPAVVVDMKVERKNEEHRRNSAANMRCHNYYRWMLTNRVPSVDIRTYDLTEPLTKRYLEEKALYVHDAWALIRRFMRSELLSNGLVRMGEIGFTVYLIWRLYEGTVTVGDVSLYLSMALSVSDSFWGLASTFTNTFRFMLERMKIALDFFDAAKPETKEYRELCDFTSLEFDNICFRYPETEIDILKGVSFKINRGDRVSFVGINGAGKTTIIKLMLGLYEPYRGTIRLNGYDIHDYRIEDVRLLFSVLFQDFVPYSFPLRDNVALSDISRVQNDEEIIEALKKSGIYEVLEPRMERGLDSYMMRTFDDHGLELSKGQWQKLAIARVYFKQAPIIVLDEPSSALDAEAEHQIFQQFDEMAGDKTRIMISHRISNARSSNQVLVLSDGVISESGTHEELLAQGGLYAQLFEMQKSKYAAGIGEEDDHGE